MKHPGSASCILLVLGVGILGLAGCGRAPSPPSPVSAPSGPSVASTPETSGDPQPPPNSTDEPIARQIERQISEQLDKVSKNLEEKRLTLLVHGVRDREQWSVLRDKIEKLIDEGDSRSIANKQGYGDGYLVHISPVDDLSAAADQIDFGGIVAVDPDERTIVVDVSRPAASRPESGWPGKEALKVFLQVQAAQWVAKEADEEVVRQHGRERVLVVAMFSTSDDPGWAEPFDSVLRKLPDGIQRTISYPTYGPDSQNAAVATLGPAENFVEVRDGLGQNVVYADEQLRVIIVQASATN